MANASGRDQRTPMERLVRIAAVLQAAGERGVSGDRLAAVAGFAGADPGTQLSRELRHLARQGWQIDNVAAPGDPAVYRMTTVDNRLRVRLSPAQQAELRRAVLLADRGDLVARLGLPDSSRPADVVMPAAAEAAARTPEALARVVDAVRDRRTLRFGYKGAPRLVHPESVRNQDGVWYLRAVEDADRESGPVKTFVVDRMSGTETGAPGSAHPVRAAHHDGLHPLTWQVDPPVDVELETSPAFEPDVRRWLGEPVAVETGPGDVVRLRYRVSHRAALRARLNELGRRVRLVGPAEVRDEVIAALAAAAGEGER